MINFRIKDINVTVRNSSDRASSCLRKALGTRNFGRQPNVEKT